MRDDGNSEKIWRKTKQKFFDGLQKCFGGRGIKGVKMVGNAAVASSLPSSPPTAPCSVGVGAKIATANVKAATRGESEGRTASSP